MATEKTTQILEEIKALTILELADLVKALEEEFGVSAAPVAVAAVGAAAPVVEELGDTYVIIKAVSGAEYGYAKNSFFGGSITWGTSNRIDGLSASTKYKLYIRIPESATTNASANSAATEITTYEKGYDPYAVKGSISVSGTGAYGNTLTADISGLAAAESGATYSYQWNRDGVAIEEATSKSYKIIAEDIGTKISVTVTAKSPFTGTFTSSAITL